MKNTVNSLFDERIEPEIDDAKLADIWPIEMFWGAIKERLRGKQFNNELDLENQVLQQWRMFTVEKCQEIMEKIPNRLKLLIDQNGEQIHSH